MNEIVVNALLEAEPGKAEELEAALREVLAPSRAEDGNVLYELHRDRKDPNRFMFHEIWKSADAIKEHNGRAHYQKLSVTVGPLLAKPPALSTWTRVDPAS